MRSRDFVYWLQGFFEITGATSMDASQVQKVRDHLNLVFKHEIDPAMGNEKHQAELNAIHSPVNPLDIRMRC